MIHRNKRLAAYMMPNMAPSGAHWFQRRFRGQTSEANLLTSRTAARMTAEMTLTRTEAKTLFRPSADMICAARSWTRKLLGPVTIQEKIRASPAATQICVFAICKAPVINTSDKTIFHSTKIRQESIIPACFVGNARKA
jgi:hypothetical protein